MLEIIFLIIFIVSFAGLLVVLARKIPVLNTLPQNGNAGIRNHHYILTIENKVKEFMVAFEKQIYLHKFLSFVKIMTLKLETKIDSYLQNLRKKAQKIDKELKDKK